MKNTNVKAPTARIQSAFATTSLVIEQDDAWSSYLDADGFEAGAANQTWDQLNTGFLEQHHDAISYAPPSLFAALLPAWLAALLADADDLDLLPYFVLPAIAPGESDSDATRFRERVELLNSPQKAAVAHALEALAKREDYADHRDDIQHALKSYWSTHLR